MANDGVVWLAIIVGAMLGIVFGVLPLWEWYARRHACDECGRPLIEHDWLPLESGKVVRFCRKED